MDDYSSLDTFNKISTLLTFLTYLFSPLISIWALNTLFSTGIPISIKTWFAGLLLIFVLRFIAGAGGGSRDPGYSPGYNYDDEFDDDFDDDDYWPDEDYPAGPKAKLILHPGGKDARPDKD